MERKLFNKKVLTILLSSLFVLLTGLSISLSGAFSAKAEEDLLNPTSTQLYMLDGAEVEMTGYSIRFTTEIKEDYYNRLVETYGNVVFGTEISPKGRTGEELPIDYYNVSDIEFKDGVGRFYGVLKYSSLQDEMSVKEMATLDMTAKSFIKVGGKTIYAHRNDTTRSMRALANLALINRDFKNNELAENQLRNYLGEITRQEGVQQLSSSSSVVSFDQPVSGSLYINSKKIPGVHLVNATKVDIGAYLTEVDREVEFTVSVMGSNRFDVTSVQAINSGLDLIYRNAAGDLVTEYQIITETRTGNEAPSAAGQSLAYMVNEMTGVLIPSPSTSWGYKVGDYSYRETESKLTDYTYSADDKYISIGYTKVLEQSGIEYDKEELERTGGFMMVVKDNSIFLFGGTSGTNSLANGANYAVDDFLQMIFGFEVYGTLPDPIQQQRAGKDEAKMDNPISSLKPYEKYIYKYTYEKGNEVLVPTTLNVKSLPSIENRSIQYSTITGDLEGYRIYRPTYSLNNSLSIYSITYEDYKTRIASEGDGYEVYKCSSCGRTQIAKEMPTACTGSTCSSTTFEDITLTIEAYKKHTAYTCKDCYNIRVGFVTPTTCLHCHANPMGVVENTTAGNWHTNFFWLPIQENISKSGKIDGQNWSAEDWYGEREIWTCNTCGYQRDYEMPTCGACYKAGRDYDNITSAPLRVLNNGKFTTQLCFTAHGNETARAAMVDALVEKLKNTLIVYEDLDADELYGLTLSDHDATSHCTCENCQASLEKYGSLSGIQIEVINEINEKILAWMNENPRYAKNIILMPFAYVDNDQKAPVEWDAESKKWVGKEGLTAFKGVTNNGKTVQTSVFLVTSYAKVQTLPEKEFDGTDYLYSEVKNKGENYENNEQRLLIQQWKDFIDGAKMYLWYNSQEYNYSTFPSYSEELFDEDFYKFIVGEDGDDIDWIYNYNCQGGNAISGYHNLRLYVTSKLNWDASLSPAALREEWFNGIFKNDNVVEAMQRAFNYEMNMAIESRYHYTNPVIPEGVDDTQPYEGLAGPFGAYWPMEKLLTLYNLYEDALATARKKITDQRTLQEVESFIYSEMYFPTAMLLRYYIGNPGILDVQDELIATLEYIVNELGLDWDVMPPRDVLANTHVELVVQERYRSSGTVRSNWKPITDYSFYDAATNTIKLTSADEDYRYDLKLRIKDEFTLKSYSYSEGRLVYTAKTYTPNSSGLKVTTVKNYYEREVVNGTEVDVYKTETTVEDLDSRLVKDFSVDVNYHKDTNELANSGLNISGVEDYARLCYYNSTPGEYLVHCTYSAITADANWLFGSSYYNVKVVIAKN